MLSRLSFSFTFCAAFLLISGIQPAAGQITYDGCRDIRGMPVASVPRAINDVAKADIAPNREPVIIYNPSVLAWLAPETRLFWYGHECGHHALGHNFGTAHPLQAEQQADCWGIQTLIDQGMLHERDLPIIQRDIAQSPGDWTHLPGPRRAINLARCLRRTSGSDRSSDSCRYARDDECDEPDLCEPGTDSSDCSRRRSRTRSSDPDSCEYAFDGECDEPEYCARGTDTSDCHRTGRSRRRTSAPMPPPASVCMTNFGGCPMGVRIPIGSACHCPSAYGPVPGIAN